jgi:hypothetical protein
VDFGDRVRAIEHPDTRAAGIVGRTGVVHGYTTPSHGYLTDPIIGRPVDDVAIAVAFGDELGVLWIVPELIELVDHGAGTTMTIGGEGFVRLADGTWQTTERTGPGSRLLARLRRGCGSPR